MTSSVTQAGKTWFKILLNADKTSLVSEYYATKSYKESNVEVKLQGFSDIVLFAQRE
jgi:hypothetical protein